MADSAVEGIFELLVVVDVVASMPSLLTKLCCSVFAGPLLLIPLIFESPYEFC